MYETSCQSRFDAWYWMLGAGALGWPRGRVWGGRREEGSGWGTHVYLWWIHFDIWQNQYNYVKFKNKIKLKKKKEQHQQHPKKLSIKKTKIMASGPITSWQIGKQWKQWETLFLGGSEITADGDCSNEIKRCLEEKLWST